jgi:hypothetical protein
MKTSRINDHSIPHDYTLYNIVHMAVFIENITAELCEKSIGKD